MPVRSRRTQDPFVRRSRLSGRLVAISAFAIVAACAPSGTGGDAARDTALEGAESSGATLSEAEREAGWRLLFDGETLEGWRSYDSAEPPDGWRAEDGTLHRYAGGGDIMTVDTFGNFELSLEWRVAESGNSGIFYRAATGSDGIFQSAPEMQVLDDAGHPNGSDPLTSAGANYGLHPAPRGVVRPAGEWNHARIVVQRDHVEHWLNGTKLLEYELGSEDWNERVANSKFAEWPEYGTAERGHIGLQDHGDPVWYRDIKIRRLPTLAPDPMRLLEDSSGTGE